MTPGIFGRGVREFQVLHNRWWPYNWNFREKISRGYNSVSIDESDMSDIKCEINRRLVTWNNIDITCVVSGEVHAAIKRLNAGKNNMDIGMYSNHIFRANDIFMKNISNLFSMMLSHKFTSKDMIRAVINSGKC